MRNEPTVVIIGGGVMGASVAFHLVNRGCRNVVLLEKEDLFGTGATGQNAGGIRHQFSTAVNVELSKLSIAMLRNFEREMGQEIDLRFCGYLFLLDREEDVASFQNSVNLQNELGVATRWIHPGEISERIPQVSLEGILGGTFYEGDGLADPSGVLQGYLSAARRLGAELRTESPVTAFEIRDGRVVAVQTPQGLIEADWFVLAAGPWSGRVGELAGLEIPVVPVRRQIAVTSPIPEIDPSFPFVIDFGKSLYFHLEGGGILTGMSNPAQAPGFDIRVDQDWRLVHFAAALQRLPLLERAGVLREWAGLYEVTPDHQPILGRLPHCPSVVLCTGFSGHGFMHAPAAGLLIAEEILDGRAHSINIDSLRWERFRSGVSGEHNVV